MTYPHEYEDWTEPAEVEVWCNRCDAHYGGPGCDCREWEIVSATWREVAAWLARVGHPAAASRVLAEAVWMSRPQQITWRRV
jgi:hypothetical protein